MNWSLQQTAVFNWFAYPTTNNLVVRSRAGTGKTTTIVNGVLAIQGAARILVCAFNKRIQEELKAKLAGTNAEALTLHSLGFKFLRGAWGNLTLDNEIEDERIEDASDGEDLRWDVVAAIKKLISVAKGAMPFGTEEELVDLAIEFGCEVDDFDTPSIANYARRAMDAAKIPDCMHRITFDDMLFVPVVNKYAVPLYDWVIVDEAQDMNYSQLRLAMASCKADGHIVVVGDDKQAIYGFRGADSCALDRLKVELKADELGLNTTYRCPKKVVEQAAKLVGDFFAAPDAPEGRVDVGSVDHLDGQVHPGDVILSRTNAPLVPLCLSFIRKGIAAKIEGRDIGKMLADRARKMRATSVEDFLNKVDRWSRSATSKAIAYGKNVDRKLQQIRDVAATLEALTEDCHTVQDIYDRCTKMFVDIDNRKATITLSTVHKAKGLEWETVYILADTLYVYGKVNTPEEVNIHYVALTRAKSNLVMVHGHHAGS
jgi:superfamily I DNA/RNA helicase